jgi:hypothetical protein
MKLVDALINLLQKKSTGEEVAAPEGVCPNCWGREEYGGKFYEAVKNRGIDATHPNKSAGWIQEYAETHLKGIHLTQKGDQQVCQTCKISYRPE